MADVAIPAAQSDQSQVFVDTMKLYLEENMRRFFQKKTNEDVDTIMSDDLIKHGIDKFANEIISWLLTWISKLKDIPSNNKFYLGDYVIMNLFYRVLTNLKFYKKKVFKVIEKYRDSNNPKGSIDAKFQKIGKHLQMVLVEILNPSFNPDDNDLISISIKELNDLFYYPMIESGVFSEDDFKTKPTFVKSAGKT